MSTRRGEKITHGRTLLSLCPQWVHPQVCFVALVLSGIPALLILTQPSHGTALQWAKRRGPRLHHGLLHSLFRKGKIKLFLPSDSKIKTITAHFPLPEGSQLLIPRQALLAQQTSQPSANKPDLTTSAALALCEKLRRSVLYKDEELLVINKPQELAVQGGQNIKLSLDTIMDTALASDRNDTLR